MRSDKKKKVKILENSKKTRGFLDAGIFIAGRGESLSHTHNQRHHRLS